jgi:hypothetical protein
MAEPDRPGRALPKIYFIYYRESDHRPFFYDPAKSLCSWTYPSEPNAVVFNPRTRKSAHVKPSLFEPKEYHVHPQLSSDSRGRPIAALEESGILRPPHRDARRHIVSSPVLSLKGKQFDKKAVTLSKHLASYLELDIKGTAVSLSSVVEMVTDTLLIDELYAQLLQLSDELRSATLLPEKRVLGFCDFVILATSRWAPETPSVVVAVRRLLAGWALGEIMSLRDRRLADYQRRMQFAYIRFDSVLSMKGRPPFPGSLPRTSWKTSECFQVGVSLYECMWRQRRSHPSVPVPTIMLILEEAILAHNGRDTEGVFRHVGNMKLLDEVVEQINHGYRNWVTGLGTHDLASLYKRWIRAIPGGLVDASASERIYDGAEPFDIVAHMAPLHRNVLLHLIGFLKDLATAEPVTKMSISNLALVFGSSVSVGHPMSDPTIIQEFPRHAKAFVEKLLNESDVSSMYPLTLW